MKYLYMLVVHSKSVIDALSPQWGDSRFTDQDIQVPSDSCLHEGFQACEKLLCVYFHK